MNYGLSDKIIESIQKVFETVPTVDKVILFGSRAKGNFRPGSDIDLVIQGQNYTFNDNLNILAKLDDLNLPYKIDLIDYKSIKEKALVEHIDRVGIEIYSRGKE